ncbi:MAG TPA: type II toxin-antitoxin system mRNA interferase toxin, RelE/StbE family [Dehalococcoidia bacterium]|jgi:addiction module RelE/StbE family toxin
MTYRLFWEPHFTRRARSFLRKHPELQAPFDRLLDDLRSEPFPERIRVHALGGHLDGLHSARLTRSYRVVFRLRNDAKLLDLVDVGSHDDMY